MNSPKRGLINIAILLAVFAILFGAPLLRSVVASGSPGGTAMAISFGLSPNAPHKVSTGSFNIGFKDTSVNFDSKNNLWTYQITARNQLNEDAEIVEIISLHQPSGGFINIFSEKRQLAPPFGEDIEVLGGEKTNEKVVVKPGSAVTLKIFLKDPALVISLVEKRGRYDIGFWGFADEYPQMRTETKTEVKLEIVEALDPNVKVFLAGTFPPTPETFKTHFAASEPIYPQEQGLAKGTKYRFQVVNATGEIIIPLDLDHLGEARYGTGVEGHGMFNSGKKPLPSGSYRIELIKVEGGKGFIVAYENFSVS